MLAKNAATTKQISGNKYNKNACLNKVLVAIFNVIISPTLYSLLTG